MSTPNPDEIAEARRDYADWFMREKLADEALAQVKAGAAAMRGNSALFNLPSISEILGWFFGPENSVDGLLTEEAIKTLLDTAEWLQVEAHRNRLYAEGLLLAMGQDVMSVDA